MHGIILIFSTCNVKLKPDEQQRWFLAGSPLDSLLTPALPAPPPAHGDGRRITILLNHPMARAAGERVSEPQTDESQKRGGLFNRRLEVLEPLGTISAVDDSVVAAGGARQQQQFCDADWSLSQVPGKLFFRRI